MKILARGGRWVAIFAFAGLSATGASAQSPTNLNALRGLAPVSALANSESGKAALAANLAITGAIQNHKLHQPTLLPFSAQQQLALRDAFITDGNASGLADGLGSTLGRVYQSLARYTSQDDGKTTSFTNVSPATAKVIAYANAIARSDAGLGKFFFANATIDNKTPVSANALAILKNIDGTEDVFGKAYGFPAGHDGADRYGNSRPFQTEPHFTEIHGRDFFGVASSSTAWLRGPSQNLVDSPSFPSGHTTYAYTEGLLLALLVPERYPQMIARSAEYGNDRIIVGAHYAMDVLGGRTLAIYDIAQLLANKPGYVGLERGGVRVDDFQQALAAARADVGQALSASCRKPVTVCATLDRGRFARSARNRAFYAATQTYGLPIVFARTAKGTEDVAELAPEAGYLLTTAFPYLTLAQANAILTSTEGPGGGFLDNGSAFGVYSRLDLYRASQKAMAMAPLDDLHLGGRQGRFAAPVRGSVAFRPGLPTVHGSAIGTGSS